GELVAAALEELEASFPYVQGRQVIATDEEGDPLFEDIGPTPRFLSLSRRHLHDLSSTAGDSEK
ncbi:MAG: pilin assembly protein, partial [Pseudomonadales bacterium]